MTAAAREAPRWRLQSDDVPSHGIRAQAWTVTDGSHRLWFPAYMANEARIVCDALNRAAPSAGEAREPQVRWVQQEASMGCGVACLAMLTGDTYAAVRAKLEAIPLTLRDDDEINTAQLDRYLSAHGFAVARRMNGLVGGWPPEPFADRHFALVQHHLGGNGHYVVVAADGRVLDPLDPAPRRLTDYAAVHWVAGVAPLRAVLAAAGQERREEGGWQPIETAPKDGTRILVYIPGARHEVREVWCAMEWEGGPLYWSTPIPAQGGRGFMILLDSPTHWMPLPPAPGSRPAARPAERKGEPNG